MESIDVFCHFLPMKYCQAVEEASTSPLWMFKRAQQIEVMVDLDARLALMRQFDGYRQIICLASPPVEKLAADHAVELARLANDELAAAAAAGGDSICGFVASLPLNDVAESQAEACRAVEELGAVGVQIFTHAQGLPMDDPRFEPLFEQMAGYDLPLLLHPTRTRDRADYPSEQFSKYDLWWAIGWPYETTLAMARLAIGGIFERLPNLKIVTHHVGGFMPMLAGRLGPGMQLLGTRHPPGVEPCRTATLSETLVDACGRFLADTASFGSQEAIECGLKFFGLDRLLFATDMPFDPGGGPDYIHSTLSAVRNMDLTDDERQQILSGNARRVFRLEH